MNKKYIWCFMGQVHAQGARAEMIDVLKETGGQYYCSVNSAWQSKDSLSTQDYKKILEQSIFVPCPRGNSSPDTFRLYETLEAGSIPIVERDEYWSGLFGDDHPLIQVSDWSKAANDISVLAKETEWLEEYSQKLVSWWHAQKNTLKQKIKTTINQPAIIEKSVTQNDPQLKTKQQQLIQLTKDWQNFVDYDFLKYICREMPKPDVPSEKFSVYNPGKKIAIVSLYTHEIADYAVCSEKSIREYCERQGYTFYVYRDKLDANGSANWSKARAILNHIDDHEDVVWMDSDTIIFNPEKRFEDILARCTGTKKIIACEDVGTNNKKMPKGSMLNSGVLIFRNHFYTKNLIKKWMNFDGDKSSLYASGGDQEILCDILKKSDGFGFNRKVFPMNEFNTEPRFVDENTFIVHFMAYPHQLKTIFMNYWVSR